MTEADRILNIRYATRGVFFRNFGEVAYEKTCFTT